LRASNDKIDAQRALAMGIVNRVVPLGSELDTALRVARDIAAA
jgi:enoyl-CoA hydratase/carnithine racemase